MSEGKSFVGGVDDDDDDDDDDNDDSSSFSRLFTSAGKRETNEDLIF